MLNKLVHMPSSSPLVVNPFGHLNDGILLLIAIKFKFTTAKENQSN